MDVVVGKVFPEVVAEAKTPGVAQRVALVVDRVADRVAGLDERANKGELMAYTDIEITAPSSAEEGELVSVSALVTNITELDLPFRVRLYAVEDIYAVPKPEELIGSFEEVIESGASKTISGSFTMPAWDTTILVMVHRFVVYWDYDTHASKIVSLKTKVALPAVLGIGLAVLGIGVLGGALVKRPLGL
jgi:hypothetical protein